MGDQFENQSQLESEMPEDGDLLLLKDHALNVAAEGITIADMRLPDQPLIYVNEGFERLTGYSAGQIVGKNCRFLQGENTDPATVKKIRDALATGRECTVELLNLRRNGEAFWNRLSLTPVRNALGEITHFIGIQSDITARKNAEDAVREANRRLEEANRRMKSDLDAAARIQQSLLPDRAPKEGRVRFSWFFEPCDELAGDFLDVVALDENRYAVYTVDVSGHGVPAALLSVSLSHWFSRLFQAPRSSQGTGDAGQDSSHLSPVKVAEALNRQFQMNLNNSQYFTMCYGIIDVEQREFRYVTAGSPAIVVARESREPEVRIVPGFPVGIVEHPRYSEQVIRLGTGDRVFLYTDGVVEAEDTNEIPFGTEGLVEEIASSRERTVEASVDLIIEKVKQWVGPRGLSDDVSILVFELD